MTQDQITSIVRAVLQHAAGLLVARGIIAAGDVELVVGAVLGVLVAGWTIYSHRKAGLVQSAARLRDVASIEASPRLADAVPSDKVRAPA